MKHTKFAVAAIALVAITSASTLFAATATSTGTAMATPTAATMSSAPRLVKKDATSVTLEWDKVAGASAYIVKYSTTSVANSTDPNAQYDNESDQVTATGVTVDKLSATNEKLAPNTAYYFSVVSVDKDGKESDTFSDELMVTTDAAPVAAAAASGATASGTAMAASLSVADVLVTDDSTLTVTFNADLSADEVKVKVTKKSDNSEVVVNQVAKNATNPKAVTVVLAGKLAATSAYTLTVIAAKDVNGGNIADGVNGLKEFTTPDQMAAAAGTTMAPAEDASGAMLSGAIAPTNATKVATGTKENLLILAALVLSLGIVYIYRRKLS